MVDNVGEELLDEVEKSGMREPVPLLIEKEDEELLLLGWA